jgi:hypothetical protein
LVAQVELDAAGCFVVVIWPALYARL